MRALAQCGAFLAAAIANAAAQPAGPPPGAPALKPAPEIPFVSVPEPLKLPPNLYFGEVAGVALNSKHHVFVFSRGNTVGSAYTAAAAQLLEFGPDGKFLREIGHNFYAWGYAHSVKIDPWDNIWITDKGSDMVVKFDPQGRVAMVFGRKQEASDAGSGPIARPKPGSSAPPPVDGLFRQVTDIAWAADGTGYISDGYINTRVAKVSRDGDWLGSYGTPGNGPGQFSTPHSIATDMHDNVYVADRGNRRIQVFDRDMKFLRQITIDVPVPPGARPAIGGLHVPPPSEGGPPAGMGALIAPGSPWTICITPGPHQFLYASDAFPGRIYKMTLDGQVLGVLGSSGKVLGKFGWIHEMACPSENELWVAELLNWRVQKLELHPTP